jgi:hypothetical protein
MALDGEWLASSKNGFYPVEKASGNAMDMLDHRAQALWIKERPLIHQELNLHSLFSFCCHPACRVVPRARGGVVVKALRYKPAGRVFDSRWCHWNF